LQNPNEATPQKVKRGGPEMWFQGYPNLIYYSKFYGNKNKITMKELVKRRAEIDEQILEKVETLEALKKTLKSVEDSQIDSDGSTKKLFNQNIVKFISRLEESQEEWKWIDTCCKEMEQKQKHV
jgi:hypothetical protein